VSSAPTASPWGLADAGQHGKAGGQRLDEGERPAQRDAVVALFVGGGQFVPFVQHLGQAHMRHASGGQLVAGLGGSFQPLLVGAQRRTQSALGLLDLAKVVGGPQNVWLSPIALRSATTSARACSASLSRPHSRAHGRSSTDVSSRNRTTSAGWRASTSSVG